jgi:NADPH-dependent curcumin reductase CurA
VVVAAASGAVGSMVGQIAKIKGCRVIGIAGGAVFDAVLPLLNASARVPVCGLIANYNDTALPEGPDRMGLLIRTILTKRLKVQGFIIFDDYGQRYGEFFTQMSAWLKEGKIKLREDIVDGLENAPQAFIGLLEGKNFGKLVIRVAQD